MPLRPLRALREYVRRQAYNSLSMLLALIRAVPRSIDRCELTHLERTPIDYAKAVREHDAYEECLRRLGCRVQRLPEAHDMPDSVFVEDTAVVFDEIAVIARPGAVSRRGEVEAAAHALRPHRQLAFIEPPATLDGGDVLVTPGKVFVGITPRTNADGARQLAAYVAPFGFETIPVPVTGCLHLKSAVTLARVGTVVINPDWVDAAVFEGFDRIDIAPEEPMAANVLLMGDRVVCAEEHPRTRQRLEAHGIVTVTVPAAELARAEGGVTCCSLLVRNT